ncbi:hypothetical protein F4823DRAFT_566606 [Ustulina deusta]|nr:hypothetical protein F4823DRAFT_566606 [Ustulina deusta]
MWSTTPQASPDYLIDVCSLWRLIMASIEGPATEQLTTDTPNEASTLGSSWVQSLPEIPYADVISAHSVNAFVPLILVRELLPIMSDGNPGGNPSNRARGYIRERLVARGHL